MGVSVPFVLLLSCCIQAFGAQPELLPEHLAVLRGQEARFTCSTFHFQWAVMTWLINGATVLTISKEHGILPSTSANVTAEKRNDSRGDSWVFVLKNTQRHHEGQVACDLQNNQIVTATLYVQEKGSVKIIGANRTALRGQRVLFECEATGWYPQPSLEWQVNNKKVGESEYNVSYEASENVFTMTSRFTLQAARSSYVDCGASVSSLPAFLYSRVYLTVVVEVLEKEDDCTTLLAVTATLSALLLLLLLLLPATYIYFSYRQRRHAKSRLQEAIRFNQSINEQNLVAEATRGKVNLGYSGEDLKHAGHNELIKETGSQMNSFSIHKSPHVVSSSNPSLHRLSEAGQTKESSKNVKRITTV